MFKTLKKVKTEAAVFLLFILVRIPYLGFDIINTDAPIWKTRTFQFSSAVFNFDFAGTAVTYHPGVVLMWISALGVKAFNLLGDFFTTTDTSTVEGYVGMHFTQKFFLIIVLSLLVSISFYLLRKLYNTQFAFLFFFIFTFEPYVLGLTRVLHTDALVAFFSFLCVLSLYYGLTKSKKGMNLWIVVSAVSAGLALLTKSNSLFLLGFTGLLMFILFLKNRKSVLNLLWKTVKYYLFWLLFVLLTFVVFWPAMWVNPIETISLYISGITDIGFENHDQEWFGEVVSDPGPLFYPIIIFIRLTPILVITFLSGVLLFLYDLIKNKKVKDYFLMFSLLFSVLYLILLAIPEKKLGRYVLPVIPFLVVFSVYYIQDFIKVISKKYSFGKLTLGVLTSLIFVFFSFFSTYKFVPDYLMYFSQFVGGFQGGRRIEEPKWPLGYRKLALYLNSLPEAEDRLALVRYGYLFNPFHVGSTGTLSQETEKDPGVYAALEKSSDFRYFKKKGISLRNVMKIGDVDYFWIYEITHDY